MTARAAPAGQAGTADVRGALARFLERHCGRPVTITACASVARGTMREAWAVDTVLTSGGEPDRLVYLEDRGGALFDTRLHADDELRILRAMHAAGIRVPRPRFRVDAGDPSGLGPGLLVDRVEGEAVARRVLRDPAFDAVRPRLLAELGEELARIHAVPLAGLERLARARPGEPPVLAQLDELERVLRAIGEPHPALELALRWLRAGAPACARPALVHGDYRLGNVLVDPARGLAAVLDWELAHVGDPGEDVLWFCIRFWRALDAPGHRGLGPRERFLDAYARAGGRRFDPDAARYWEVFGNFRWAIVTLAQAWRHVSGRERDLELASIGRHCAEVEWEILRLLGEA